LTPLEIILGLPIYINGTLLLKKLSINKISLQALHIKKYKLKLQGLDNSGIVVSVTPAKDVFVYDSSSHILCSKDFAVAAVLSNVLSDPGTFEGVSFS